MRPAYTGSMAKGTPQRDARELMSGRAELSWRAKLTTLLPPLQTCSCLHASCGTIHSARLPSNKTIAVQLQLSTRPTVFFLTLATFLPRTRFAPTKIASCFWYAFSCCEKQTAPPPQAVSQNHVVSFFRWGRLYCSGWFGFERVV